MAFKNSVENIATAEFPLLAQLPTWSTAASVGPAGGIGSATLFRQPRTGDWATVEQFVGGHLPTTGPSMQQIILAAMLPIKYQLTNAVVHHNVEIPLAS